MAVTFRLGWWQLDRAAQKEALQQAIDSRGAAPPLALPELARDAAAAEQQQYRHIELQGRWLSEHTIYLDNRQMDGHPGFFVLTPLLLPAGDAVLVQRGWLPRDVADRTRIPTYATPAGDVTVAGRIAPPPSRLQALGADAAGPIRQNVELASYARETGLALRPLSLLELAGTRNAADGLRRDWPRPAVDVQKHYGYAVQWFLFCAATAVLYVWFQLIRRKPHDAGA